MVSLIRTVLKFTGPSRAGHHQEFDIARAISAHATMKFDPNDSKYPRITFLQRATRS